jgi:hypothetical protein
MSSTRHLPMQQHSSRAQHYDASISACGCHRRSAASLARTEALERLAIRCMGGRHGAAHLYSRSTYRHQVSECTSAGIRSWRQARPRPLRDNTDSGCSAPRWERAPPLGSMVHDFKHVLETGCDASSDVAVLISRHVGISRRVGLVNCRRCDSGRGRGESFQRGHGALLLLLLLLLLLCCCPAALLRCRSAARFRAALVWRTAALLTDALHPTLWWCQIVILQQATRLHGHKLCVRAERLENQDGRKSSLALINAMVSLASSNNFNLLNHNYRPATPSFHLAARACLKVRVVHWHQDLHRLVESRTFLHHCMASTISPTGFARRLQ